MVKGVNICTTAAGAGLVAIKFGSDSAKCTEKTLGL